MAFIPHQLLPGAAGLIGYASAKILAQQTATQFAAVRGANVGVGGWSCCSAVAVVPSALVPAIPGQPFGVMFGNSRMLGGGLAHGAAGGHAERAVLGAVNHHGQTLHNFGGAGGGHQYVMYVDLQPCVPCVGWLAAASPATAPFTGANAANALHVYWHWVLNPPNPTHPDHGPAGMAAFNSLGPGAQAADIATW